MACSQDSIFQTVGLRNSKRHWRRNTSCNEGPLKKRNQIMRKRHSHDYRYNYCLTSGDVHLSGTNPPCDI